MTWCPQPHRSGQKFRSHSLAIFDYGAIKKGQRWKVHEVDKVKGFPPKFLKEKKMDEEIRSEVKKKDLVHKLFLEVYANSSETLKEILSEGGEIIITPSTFSIRL